MTPLERAARALHEMSRQSIVMYNPANPDAPPEIIDDGFTAWDVLSEQDRRALIESARAVLAAIREPSEDMLDRAEDQEAQSARGTAGNMWRAMIDAALEEG